LELLDFDEKFTLIDHFSNDGITSFAFVLVYLPLYLSNALDNAAVGMLRALQVLAEVVKLLHARWVNDGHSWSVTVDIRTLAELAGEAPSPKAFNACVDYIRIKNTGNNMTLLISAERSSDLREHVERIYHSVKQLQSKQAQNGLLLSSIAEKQSAECHLSEKRITKVARRSESPVRLPSEERQQLTPTMYRYTDEGSQQRVGEKEDMFV